MFILYGKIKIFEFSMIILLQRLFFLSFISFFKKAIIKIFDSIVHCLFFSRDWFVVLHLFFIYLMIPKYLNYYMSQLLKFETRIKILKQRPFYYQRKIKWQWFSNRRKVTEISQEEKLHEKNAYLNNKIKVLKLLKEIF